MAAPAAAPASIARMAAPRLCQRGLSPPARLESAANPAIVNVSTVVVKSGIASFRTTELRSPIANAVRAMTEKIFCLWSAAVNPVEIAAAKKKKIGLDDQSIRQRRARILRDHLPRHPTAKKGTHRKTNQRHE